jgi:hypothetical protein
MSYIIPGSLQVISVTPDGSVDSQHTDRDQLEFQFQAEMEFLDTLLGWDYSTTFHIMYQLTTADNLQWAQLASLGSETTWENASTLGINNPAMATIVVPQPDLPDGKYNFIVMTDQDYTGLPPYNATRTATVTNYQIIPYVTPPTNPVTISVQPTPSTAAVTIDGAATASTTVEAGQTVQVVAELYGYTVYNQAITANSNYIGSTMVTSPVLTACSISSPSCYGYVATTSSGSTSGNNQSTCASTDTTCQITQLVTQYWPIIAVGAVALVLLTSQPPSRSGGGGRGYGGAPIIITQPAPVYRYPGE